MTGGGLEIKIRLTSGGGGGQELNIEVESFFKNIKIGMFFIFTNFLKGKLLKCILYLDENMMRL